MKKCDSDPLIPEDVAAELLQRTRDDFEHGRIFVGDPQYPHTVEFKLRDYRKWLQRPAEQASGDAPDRAFEAMQPHMQRYLKGVLVLILGGTHYKDLVHVAPHIDAQHIRESSQPPQPGGIAN